MPTFDRDALRKGSKAIDAALEARKRGDSDRRPFLPNIFWKSDKDYRYLLFLNPLEEIPTVEFHPYVDCGDGVPHMTIARTDPIIGASVDPLQEQWGYKPRVACLAIAAELEPITEIINGRAKPTGFEVKTVEFERKVRDAEGKPTDEVEQVVAPVVGLVAQSPFNFFNQLRSFDASEAAIHSTPVKVARIGDKSNVTYQITGYDTIQPDLSNLLDYIENLSYVTDSASLIETITNSDVETATTAVGEYLLYRRLDELADQDDYNETLAKVTKPAKFQDANKKEDKAPRQARPSQRRTQSDGAEETPQARAREAEETVTKESPADARIAKLRSRVKKDPK